MAKAKGAATAPEAERPHNAMLEGGVGELRDYWLERLIMLSDGVFAIAITLMAIEVHPPHGWNGTWETLWAGSWQTLMGYVVSFGAVGAFWMAHRRIFAHVRRADTGLTVLNLLVLGLIALSPAAAELLYEYGPRGVGLQVYIGLIGATGMAQALVWGYASLVGKLITEAVPTRLRVEMFFAMLLAPLIIASAILYAISANQAWALLLVIPPIVFSNRLRRRLADHPSR